MFGRNRNDQSRGQSQNQPGSRGSYQGFKKASRGQESQNFGSDPYSDTENNRWSPMSDDDAAYYADPSQSHASQGYRGSHQQNPYSGQSYQSGSADSYSGNRTSGQSYRANQDYRPSSPTRGEHDYQSSLEYGGGRSYGAGGSTEGRYQQNPSARQGSQMPSQGQWQHQDFRNNETYSRSGMQPGFENREGFHEASDANLYSEGHWNQHGGEYQGSYQPSSTRSRSQGPNTSFGTGSGIGYASQGFADQGSSQSWGRDMSSNTGVSFGSPPRTSFADQPTYGSQSSQYGQQPSHFGKGPKGYRRSEERIKEDVSECLTHDPHIDASNVEVSIENDTVVLKGSVDSRFAKRHAEEIVESVSGVKDVRNEIRVESSAPIGSRAASMEKSSSGNNPSRMSPDSDDLTSSRSEKSGSGKNKSSLS